MKIRIAVVVIIELMLSGWATAAVKLPNVISDHMVLQRDMAVPIWGTAAPGERVAVTFRNQEKTAEAGKDGKWIVRLEALNVGGPDKLTIAGSNSIVVEDVLVGQVWLGSGQSNMAMKVGEYLPKDTVLEKLASGTYPQLRMVSSNGKWVKATPENNKAFSALLFAFGVQLQSELNEPVGLLVGAAGGTPSGMWLTPEQFAADPGCKAQVGAALAAYRPEEDRAVYDSQLAAYEKALGEYNAGAAKLTPADAKKPGAPRKPEMAGKPGELPGGRPPGFLFEAFIRAYVPYGIRGVLWDQGESGTMLRDVDQYTVMGALIKGWRHDWGQGEFPFLYIQKPSGGGPALEPSDPVTLAANKFTPVPAKYVGDGGYRELHVRIREYPNTFLVATMDLGGSTHPWNKSGYGSRAARVALGAVYHKNMEYSGPIYDSFRVDGKSIRVKFNHIGRGLVAAQSDKLQGFVIAGEDKQFSWADATIDGDTVIVRSDKVGQPVAVRYAYSASIPWANLFNKDGLPAQTFRSDSW